MANKKGNNWKTPKVVYRLTAKGYDDEDESEYVDDILESELDPDTMTNYYAYFNWLYDDLDWWDIVQVERLEIWSWNEFKNGRFRGFYDCHGDGRDLHV